MSDSFESFSIHATTTSHADRGLVARVFNSGFKEAHDTYNGLSIASDGRVYYVLCSTSIDFGGRVFRYDPRTDTLDCLGDLTEMCGEKDMKAIAQGKIHPTLSRTYTLDEVGQATLDVHKNTHQGKVGVLCLAPEAGLGVKNEELRAQHINEINRFSGV